MMIRLRLQFELAFRLDALLGLFASLLSILGGVMLFEVTLGQVESIGGWGRPEMLALVGTWALLMDLERGLLRGYHSLRGLVRTGRLEQYLIRPISTPLLLIFRGISPRLVWRVPLSLAVLLYALALRPPSLAGLTFYVVSCLISLGIYGLLVFSLQCLSFWIVEMNNLSYVVYDLMEFARYPATVYKGTIRALLSTVLPLLILANFPVQLLLHRASPLLLLHQFL